MSTTADRPRAKRIVKVTRAQIAAAQAQIHISEKLGVPVPPVIRKIAAAR